ncbi:general odorant-binding protein 83a-like isoform X2 [Prorops nasuta]|uniref:general odorant-binding protein 83a-like isoform X2 n=1 Tax=Prorops nasuta TaxID=863751 RepID=UPI0034CE1F3F
MKKLSMDRIAIISSYIIILIIIVNADIKRECRKESGVSWVSLKKLRAGIFDESDRNLKCYLKCFMSRNGIIDEQNEINIERALRNVPQSVQDVSKDLFEKCRNFPTVDPCEKAFEIGKCFLKMQPEILKSVPFV